MAAKARSNACLCVLTFLIVFLFLSTATVDASLLLPLGPLWKVENSWKDVQYLYMTDSWFDRHCYDIVVDRKYIPEAVLAVYDAAVREDNKILLPTQDPFCKI